MHWPDPAQRNRIAEIRDNLTARIAEAEREGWLGEAEGLKISFARGGKGTCPWPPASQPPETRPGKLNRPVNQDQAWPRAGQAGAFGMNTAVQVRA
jgi:hypothetical protein